MEWSDIRIFLQVAREGTMIAATGALRMDHSTISRRITRLEQQAGVPLFDRAGRRLALTAEGRMLVESAEKLESIILREVVGLRDAREDIVGPVRIGTTEEFGAHYLAPRLAALTDAHPGLEIELVALPRTFSLATREVDVVVTLDRPTTGDIRFKKLTDFEFGIYAAPAYLNARNRPLDMDQLASETWCGPIDDLLFTPELDIPFAPDKKLNPRYRTTSMTAQLGAALGGYALAILPCFLARMHSGLERLLHAEATFERTYWLAVHTDLCRHPRVRVVMRAIEAEVMRDRLLFLPSATTITDRIQNEAVSALPVTSASSATGAIARSFATAPVDRVLRRNPNPLSGISAQSIA